MSSAIVDRQLANLSKFKALAAEIAEDGFKHFVLLATGSSSLCAEVFRCTFGKQASAPELLVLDSTDPAQVAAVRAKIDPARTLFCVSSKTGTEFEVGFFLKRFFDETKLGGDHFIAITEAGSPLDELGFRQVFHAHSDSALSDFGLVPAAAMGLDVELLLKRAVATAPALKLGCDKVTVFCSKSIQSFGAWIQQLFIPGLVVVNGEPIVAAEHYGKDRMFVFIRFAADKEIEFEHHPDAPVIRIVLKDLYDLGQLFLQWETAMSVFEVQPVEETGEPASEEPVLDHDGIQLFADPHLGGSRRALGGVLRCHLDRLKPGDYFGLLAYVPLFPEYEEKLQKIRREILLAKNVATVVGFGPRFEYGAGEAYLNGPNSGVFLLITYGGGATTQAVNYFQALAKRRRRVLRIHFSGDLAGGLDHLHDLVCAAVAH